MSHELIEELKSDLEVSQNVVRIVVKELIATQQELKELKVKVGYTWGLLELELPVLILSVGYSRFRTFNHHTAGGQHTSRSQEEPFYISISRRRGG